MPIRRFACLVLAAAFCAVVLPVAVSGCADEGKIVEVDGKKFRVVKVECTTCKGEKRVEGNPCTKCFGKPELKFPCEFCAGRGKLMNTTNGDTIECAHCKGSGAMMKPCPACEGTGIQACPKCEAKGYTEEVTEITD